jgi:hypothetical protein
MDGENSNAHSKEISSMIDSHSRKWSFTFAKRLTVMILRPSEILRDIAAGKSNKQIAWNCGHGLHPIRQIRLALDADPSQICVLRRSIWPSRALP